MIGPAVIPRSPHAPGLRAAFTLLELVCVLVILGVLSATAIPAVSTIAGFKAAAARAEVSSSLVFARETAAATGIPTGVRIDLGSQEMSLVEITSVGASPTTVLDTSGEAREPVRIDRDGGVSVSAVTGSGPAGGAPIVWFGHAGVPEQRDTNGGFVQDAPDDISITFTTGQTLVVHAHTGVIE